MAHHGTGGQPIALVYAAVICGIVGALLTGVFAMRRVNPMGADGWIAGNPSQVWIQLQAIGITAVWVGVGTVVVLQLIRLVMPLRVNDRDERQGLDISAHGEEAYNTEFTG
jgi:Amt family ammonium transporter